MGGPRPAAREIFFPSFEDLLSSYQQKVKHEGAINAIEGAAEHIVMGDAEEGIGAIASTYRALVRKKILEATLVYDDVSGKIHVAELVEEIGEARVLFLLQKSDEALEEKVDSGSSEADIANIILIARDNIDDVEESSVFVRKSAAKYRKDSYTALQDPESRIKDLRPTVSALEAAGCTPEEVRAQLLLGLVNVRGEDPDGVQGEKTSMMIHSGNQPVTIGSAKQIEAEVIRKMRERAAADTDKN